MCTTVFTTSENTYSPLLPTWFVVISDYKETLMLPAAIELTTSYLHTALLLIVKNKLHYSYDLFCRWYLKGILLGIKVFFLGTNYI